MADIFAFFLRTGSKNSRGSQNKILSHTCYWKLRDLIGYAIFASRDADFLEKLF